MNKTVKFGTDGIRGNSQKFPFTNEALMNLGYSIAEWSILKYKKNNPKVLIGHDTRISCKRIKEQLERSFTLKNLEIIDAKILPTPAICKLTNYYKDFDFGIIISASHNPYYDNGIKLVDAKTGKLKPEDEKIIENNFAKNLKSFKDQTINIKNKIKKWPEAKDKYIKIIEQMFKEKFLENKKVVLDCANGSTYMIAPKIFQRLGAEVITINNEPDGKNINKNCGALFTKNLEKEILKHKADIGFAFDGDGDRVIAVNYKGQRIDGDQILALLSNHSKVTKDRTIVGTVMSNLGLDLYLKQKNFNIIRTKVGDKYVAAELLDKKLFLGGETSGHIIMTDYLNTGDGIFTALRIIEMAILKNNWELSLFKKTPQIIINVPVTEKKDLTAPIYSNIIKKHQKLLKTGRIVVRYSGTENLLRIMTEGKEEKLTINIANSLAKNFKKVLN
ncbi:phosphoglucosamine mutase [Candidatus Dependentiae bacterium]|nr:phosphoglucosamine mutase [Candidatus Dependentiae bacterium]